MKAVGWVGVGGRGGENCLYPIKKKSNLVIDYADNAQPDATYFKKKVEANL